MARWQDPGYRDPDEGTPAWHHALLIVLGIVIFIAWTGVNP